MKPGRPFAFGKFNNTPFIGLPGNPVAAVITFLMLVVNYLQKLSGIEKNEIIERLIPSNFEMVKKTGRTEWLRGSIKKINNNYFLEKFHTSGSGIISSISQTDGIIEINEEYKIYKKRNLIKVLQIRGYFKLKILYFAKIKEVIGKSEDSITINKQTTVKDIVEKLKLINESYKLAFQDLKNIKCSVNCNYINSFQTKVTNNDEIAFFPPVTGG